LGKGLAHLGDHPKFELSNGWFSLSATEFVSSIHPNQPYQVPVGHALGNMLREGDVFKVWLYPNGCLTYWLVRDGIFHVGEGYFSGALGRDIEVIWQPHGAVRPSSIADHPHVTVRLGSQTFDLEVKEEVISGPYHAKCLHLGSTMILGGMKPQIAVIMTTEQSIRDEFAAWLALKDKMGEAFREMSNKIKSLSDYTKNTKRPSEEFMTARAQIFKELDKQIQELYDGAGMPKPKTTDRPEGDAESFQSSCPIQE
jgi:hypothetical protein